MELDHIYTSASIQVQDEIINYIKNQGTRAGLTTSHVDQHEHEEKLESGLGLSFVKVRT